MSEVSKPEVGSVWILEGETVTVKGYRPRGRPPGYQVVTDSATRPVIAGAKFRKLAKAA